MAQVKLNKVSKSYVSGNRVVDEINLGIKDKEFMVLVGPSGCGKSTTLRMIAGLEDITKGEIFIGDNLVNEVPAKDRDIAMVFQNYALYPHMTVFENMAFGLKLRRYPKSEIDQRVSEAADILGIKKMLNRKPRALSGGERQRVALGRAIVRKPKVFLFDEPLSNLDAKLRVQMRTEIHKLHLRLKTTIIYVTHDQTEAMTLGDRLALMCDGRIQQVGTPQDIYDRPANRAVAELIGDPGMNLLEGHIERTDGRATFVSGDARVPLPEELASRAIESTGQPLVLGIRPEHLLPVTHQTPAAFEAVVESIETRGPDRYAHLRHGTCSLIARLGAGVEVPENGRLSWTFAADKLHLFDGHNGNALV